MMKGLLFHQKQQVVEENMSNLTSASGEASASSGNRTEAATNYPQQYLAPPPQTQPPLKKKRNLPGNPDPDAEVIALSPKTLVATNRFVCEICAKGFQRDQNLQLHRRGHNLPWKLKQRTNKEIRKKVYVCPEPSCVHHEPSRALGDLTGIKKHFCRKHGEKKWKCDKCSKKYAVQSDWKAHSKTCGTREYRCDCGTLFSRRDSFITHRAFCDALAEEGARSVTGGTNPPLPSHQGSNINLQIPQFNTQDLHSFSLKREQQNYGTTTLRPEIPPWLAPCPPPQLVGVTGGGPPYAQPQPLDHLSSSSSIFSTRLDDQDFNQSTTKIHHHENLNPSSRLGPTLFPPHPYHHSSTQPSSPHMSATALLQKAAQMGATMSSNNCKPTPAVGAAALFSSRPHQQAHVSADSSSHSTTTTTGFGLNLSSREELASGLVHHGLDPPFGTNKAAGSCTTISTTAANNPNSLFQDMIMNSLSSSSTTGFDHGISFDDTFGGIFMNIPKKDVNFNEVALSKSITTQTVHVIGKNDHQTGGGNGGGEGLTRDFLGLKALSHSDILSIAGLGNCINTSHEQHSHQSQKPWEGN